RATGATPRCPELRSVAPGGGRAPRNAAMVLGSAGRGGGTYAGERIWAEQGRWIPMTTAYITHTDCLKHEMGGGHPECPDRLRSVNEQRRAADVWASLLKLEAPCAERDDLKRVHRADYVDLIFENAPSEGYLQLDPDTAMNPHSLNAARRAAGAGLKAV